MRSKKLVVCSVCVEFKGSSVGHACYNCRWLKDSENTGPFFAFSCVRFRDWRDHWSAWWGASASPFWKNADRSTSRYCCAGSQHAGPFGRCVHQGAQIRSGLEKHPGYLSDSPSRQRRGRRMRRRSPCCRQHCDRGNWRWPTSSQTPSWVSWWRPDMREAWC